MGIPAAFTLLTMGSSISVGRSARMLATAARTSFIASKMSTSSLNMIMVVELPSFTVEVSCSMPSMDETAFSILRVTSVSSCAADAPCWFAVTVTAGNSMSGISWMLSCLKPYRPANVNSRNRTIGGIGCLIAHVAKFMWSYPHARPAGYALAPGLRRSVIG